MSLLLVVGDGSFVKLYFMTLESEWGLEGLFWCGSNLSVLPHRDCSAYLPRGELETLNGLLFVDSCLKTSCIMSFRVIISP